MKRVLHGIWSEGMVNRRLMRIGMAPRVCFLSQLTSDGKGPVMAINDGDTEINDGDTEMARVLRSTDEEWHAQYRHSGARLGHRGSQPQIVLRGSSDGGDGKGAIWGIPRRHHETFRVHRTGIQTGTGLHQCNVMTRCKHENRLKRSEPTGI
jgi:hypothetical protein